MTHWPETFEARDGAANPASSVTLTHLLTVPRRRWRWLAVFTALGVAAVTGYLTVPSARYTTTSVVTVRAVVTDPFSYPGPGADRVVNMNVEDGIATGGQVATKVARKTGDAVAAVRDRLTVEVPVGGQVLRFSYTAGSAGGAITGANSAANAYLAVRRGAYAKRLDTRLTSYNSTLAALARKEKAAEGATGTGAADRVRALNDQISTLTEQRAQIAATDLTPGTLTAPATRPVGSNRDHAALYLLAGLFGGALLGVAAAYARESGDRRVRRASDASDAAEAPLLGGVRAGPGRAHRADLDYIALAVTRLAARGRPVMLLSSRSDEGRADLAADLAAALAALGADVYLGDVLGTGDQLHNRVLTNPSARPRPLATPRDEPDPANGPDLGDTVQFPAVTLAGADRSGRRAPAWPVGTPRRFRLGTGGAAPQPIPVVEVGSGTVLVGPAADAPGGCLVLLDAPPVEVDARGPRALTDGSAILVAARDRTRVSELRRAAGRLRGAGAPPAGVILIGDGRA